MKTFPFILCVLVFFACQNQQKNQQDKLETQLEEIISVVEEESFEEMIEERNLIPNQNWWISPTSVGDFNLGDSVPEEGKFENYEVKHITFERQEEEGPNMETFHKVIILEDGKKVLEISPSVYQNKPQFIEEMTVFSEKFNNPNNVSVGTTIEEFFEIYPKAKIWYTYVSDRMIMETGTMDVQFELDKSDYAQELKIETDMDLKNKDDFKPGSKIKSIRIF